MNFLVIAAVAIVAVCAQPKIPGSDIVGVGYDGTTLESRGLPIISYTWDPSNTWTNPIYTDLTYQVPLEFYVTARPESLLVDGSIVFSNVSDYQWKEEKKSSSSGFLGFGAKSKMSLKYLRNYYEEDYSLSMSYQYHSWYEIILPPLPPPSLHPITERAVSLLPTSYNSNPATLEFQAYRNFITAFGTHYISQAVMGGMVKSTAWYHKCMLQQYGINWVKQQSGWSFLGIISSSSGNNDYKANVTAQWNEYSEQQVFIQGGKGVLFTPSDYQAWIDTIKYNPDAIFYKVEPIYDLIMEATRQTSMKQAVTDYFTEAYQAGRAIESSLAPFDPKKRPPWCTKTF